MADDRLYDVALAAALVVLHTLATRPGMSQPEELSTVTFIILSAMQGELEPPPQERRRAEPSLN
jgi:hypothetical protein